jgi:hypothetical protein
MIFKNQLKYSAFFILIIMVMVSFNGCNLARRTVSPKKVMSEDENVVRKVINAQPGWKLMELRITGRMEEDRERVSFMGTVRLDRDKQVFVLMRSTLGIELARFYANADSIWISSKMLGIKEKGDWKQAAKKMGYPIDFYALQGILTQSLFTSAGDQLGTLIQNLSIRSDNGNLRLVSGADTSAKENGIKYLNNFLINPDSYLLESANIRDINGHWITDVNYVYNKENSIKKIEIKGLDADRDFTVDINIVKKEIKDNIEINFDKF